MNYILKNNLDCEYVINKSKFIVCIRLIINKDDIGFMINEIKDQYKNATHYCYAYIIDNYEKCSDDKEPSGTAGIPILNVLKRKNLSNILCVVVRYFGGIKLGAGGLVRAYSNTVNETIKTAEFVKKIDYKCMTISFEYSKIKDVEYILKDCLIESKDFSDYITFNVKLNTENCDDIIKQLENMNIKIVSDK